jgi:hypothetical protein
VLLAIFTAPAQEPKYSLVDGHLHFLNFVEETDGMAKFLEANRTRDSTVQRQ